MAQQENKSLLSEVAQRSTPKAPVEAGGGQDEASSLDYFVGSEEASPEEHEYLNRVMSEVVKIVHKQSRVQVMKTMKSAEGEGLYEAVGNLSFKILEKLHRSARAEGKEIPQSVFFGENGAIQQTVEVLFEMAEAGGVKGADQQEQADAAYFQVMKLAGEMQEGDEESVTEAQGLLADMEMAGQGMPVPDSSGVPNPQVQQAVQQGLQQQQAQQPAPQPQPEQVG